MIDTDRLRRIIRSRGYSHRTMARVLGMTEKTLYNKLQRGVFNSDEMAVMIETLGIEDPMAVFFKGVGEPDARTGEEEDVCPE